MNEKIRDLHERVGCLLKAMYEYWEFEMPDMREHFDELPDAAIAIDELMQEAWDNLTDLISLMDMDDEIDG